MAMALQHDFRFVVIHLDLCVLACHRRRVLSTLVHETHVEASTLGVKHWACCSLKFEHSGVRLQAPPVGAAAAIH